MKYDYESPGCHGKDPDFNKMMDFYMELGWLKREFKKRLNWKLNKEWFISCSYNKKKEIDKYFLHIKKGVLNKENVLKVERFFKVIEKKLKVIKIKGW